MSGWKFEHAKCITTHVVYIYSWFSSNSEANASELPENLEEMLEVECESRTHACMESVIRNVSGPLQCIIRLVYLTTLTTLIIIIGHSKVSIQTSL